MHSILEAALSEKNEENAFTVQFWTMSRYILVCTMRHVYQTWDCGIRIKKTVEHRTSKVEVLLYPCLQ